MAKSYDEQMQVLDKWQRKFFGKWVKDLLRGKS